MVKTDELKRGWQKITVLRDTKDRTQEYTATDIAHQNGNATITDMVGHPYFGDISQSTVKRGVLALTKARLIQSTEGADRRQRFLSVKE